MTFYDKIMGFTNSENAIIQNAAKLSVKAAEALRSQQITLDQYKDILQDIKNNQDFVNLAEQAADKKMLSYLIDQAITLGPQVFTL
jgi:hypothetical protein